MMTNVVVAPSLEGLLVGCMLLTGTALVVVIIPSLLVGCILARVVSVLTNTSSLMVGCMLLLIRTVPVVVVVSTVWGGVVSSGVDTIERHTGNWAKSWRWVLFRETTVFL